MTDLKKYVTQTRLAIHVPVHVDPPETREFYPVNPRWPPDPAIYVFAAGIDRTEIDKELGR